MEAATAREETMAAREEVKEVREGAELAVAVTKVQVNQMALQPCAEFSDEANQSSSSHESPQRPPSPPEETTTSF